MGQINAVPRRINGVEGAVGQVMKCGGPGAVETWGYDDYGLSFLGTVTGIAGAPKFQCSGLIGFGNDYFEGYWVYVVWDAAGGGAPPQGEKLLCTGYDSAAGDFTVAAFSAAIVVGDKVLLIHPSVAPTRSLFSIDFWSDLKEEVAVTGAQSTIALSPVTVANLPAGATIVRAIAMFKFRMIENIFAGINKLDAAAVLPIQVDDGVATGYVTAIDFVDDAFGFTAAAREGGDVIIGDNNIAARVDGNDTYPVRWLNAKADQNNLQFNDVQCGLRIWYSV